MAPENPDRSEYVSMVPTSAYLGDGIGNLMAYIVNDSETRLASQLSFSDELECFVMEVIYLSWFLKLDSLKNLKNHASINLEGLINFSVVVFCWFFWDYLFKVKSIPGLGTTIDVILVNGKLTVGDIIVLTGTDGAIITQIRELLMPQPLKEIRVKVSVRIFHFLLLFLILLKNLKSYFL